MWKGIRSSFIEDQVWYKCFQTRRDVSAYLCPTLEVFCSLPASQRYHRVSCSQASFRRSDSETIKVYHSWDFHNVLLSFRALPSPLETQLILIFFSHASMMAVFRHPLAFGVLLVCLLLQPHACNASSKQDVAKCFDQLLQADVAFWEDAKVWIWLLLTTALCLNVISLGTRLVWTRSTAHSIPGECCQANYEKERQNEEIWKICWQSRSQNR